MRAAASLVHSSNPSTRRSNRLSVSAFSSNYQSRTSSQHLIQVRSKVVAEQTSCPSPITSWAQRGNDIQTGRYVPQRSETPAKLGSSLRRSTAKYLSNELLPL